MDIEMLSMGPAQMVPMMQYMFILENNYGIRKISKRT